MVPEIKKILFTTDLSKESRFAFDYALSMAIRYGAKITILHVMEEPSQYSSAHIKTLLGEDRWKQFQESHEQEARQILIGKRKDAAMIREALAEFREEAQKDHMESESTMEEIVVVRGNVVDEILSQARNRNYGLIVMGYYARGKLQDALLGSTPRRLLRRSKIPVMLVRLPED